MSKWLALARWSDWSTSKLPFLISAALLLAPAKMEWIKIIAITVTVISWSAFGYCINDVADRGDDARAAKRNRAAEVPAVVWCVFLAVGATAAVASAFVWASDVSGPLLAAIGLISAAVYSLPPVRLKVRGAAGLFAGAIAQWLLPVLAISATAPRGWMRPETWSVALLGCAIGMRWMAVHQLLDEEADRRAGVKTFVACGGRVRGVLFVAFTSECVLLLATLALTWPRSIMPVAALLFWIAQQTWLRPRGEPFARKLQTYDDAPLAEYYFLLLPLAVALARAIASPPFLLIAAAIAASGWCYAGRMMGEWAERWTAKPQRS